MGRPGGFSQLGNAQGVLPPVATMPGDNPSIAPPGMSNPATPQANMAAMYGIGNNLATAGWNPQYESLQSSTAPTFISSNAQKLVPTAKTSAELIGDANAAEQALDPSLRLTGNPILDPAERQRYEQMFSDQYLRPAIEAEKNSQFQNGRSNSSFGGAQVGASVAQGAYQAMMAGEELFNNRFNQLMQKRQSFYGNEGQMSTTAESNRLNQGNIKANMANSNNMAQNQFNADIWKSQNTFGLQAGQQAWDRQQGLWGRDDSLWNRAQQTSQFMQNQNKSMASAFGKAGGAVAQAVRSF